MDILELAEAVHDEDITPYDVEACGGALAENPLEPGTATCKQCSVEVARKCPVCEEWYGERDWENEGNYGDLTDTSLCDKCYYSDLGDHASILVRYTTEGKERVVFGDHTASGEYGEAPDWFEGLLPKPWTGRPYVRTDGWRGYFNTTLNGLVRLQDGWVGAAPWKHSLADFVEALDAETEVPPAKLYVLYEPTSNVFSTASEWLCEPESEETIKTWLASRGWAVEEELRSALG